jgi:hypothetical protein
MNQILILLSIILLLCLFSNKETFKLKKKRGDVKFSVPELTDDETADLIGGLQSIGAQACENSKYDNKRGDKNRPKC